MHSYCWLTKCRRPHDVIIKARTATSTTDHPSVHRRITIPSSFRITNAPHPTHVLTTPQPTGSFYSIIYCLLCSQLYNCSLIFSTLAPMVFFPADPVVDEHGRRLTFWVVPSTQKVNRCPFLLYDTRTQSYRR